MFAIYQVPMSLVPENGTEAFLFAAFVVACLLAMLCINERMTRVAKAIGIALVLAAAPLAAPQFVCINCCDWIIWC